MADSQTLATVAGIIGAFGSAMLLFRIQRELHMADAGETTWIPWADRLLVAATLMSLLGAVFPLISGLVAEPWRTTFASASCTAAVFLVAGYVPAILAHYRLLPGSSRSTPRQNPEPAERVLTWGLGLLAASLFVIVLVVPRSVVAIPAAPSHDAATQESTRQAPSNALWHGFYYPDVSAARAAAIGAQRLAAAPAFENLQLCIEWGRRAVAGSVSAGFECSIGCRFERAMGEVICKDSTRIMR